MADSKFASTNELIVSRMPGLTYPEELIRAFLCPPSQNTSLPSLTIVRCLPKVGVNENAGDETSLARELGSASRQVTETGGFAGDDILSRVSCLQ